MTKTHILKTFPRAFRKALRLRAGRSLLVGLLVLAFAAALVSGVVKARVVQPRDVATEKSGEAKAEFVPGEIIVRFRPHVKPESDAVIDAVPLRDGRRVNVRYERFGGSDLVEGLRLARVPADETLDAVDALNKRADVLYAEPNYIWRKEQATQAPNDTRYGELWAMKNTGQVGFNDIAGQQAAGVPGTDIDAELAWGITTGDKSVVVAVIDEGIDINHPDLQPNIWTNPGETPNDNIDNDGNGFIDDVNGWDFHNNDKTVYDGTPGDQSTDSHGTHVAGIIGAAGNNGQGVVGVNWQVSIISIKVLGKDGGSTANIVRGYNYVKKMRDLWFSSGGTRGANIRVTNNSYGGPGFSRTAYDAINAFNVEQKSVLFVAAAGNDATNNTALPHYPSDYPLLNVISVGASDRFEQMAVFSNFGQDVDLSAPGRGILSTVPNGGYQPSSGTSMAAPHVAGVAALVLSRFPEKSAVALNNLLTLSGDPIPSFAGKIYSQRRLNAFNALQVAAQIDQTPPGFVNDLRVVSQSGRNITLSWTAPGDDGNVGTAALYNFDMYNTHNVGGVHRVHLSTKIPSAAGATETVTLTLPYRLTQGDISMRVRDDVGFDGGGGRLSVNLPAAGIDPYTVSLAAPEALSTGGTALSIIGDDTFKENVALPFAFPFYGVNRTSVHVSSNGALYFSKIPRGESQGQVVGLDAGSSLQGLQYQAMIAGMWDDLRTDRGGDVFMLQPDAGRVIFRWQGVTYDRGEVPVNMEIELRIDGTILMRYGAGQSAPTNTNLTPIVGISVGEPVAYSVTSHISSAPNLISLTNAQTVVIAPHTNRAPSVGLVKPLAGAVFVAPASVGLAASATDTDGQIAKVEFFANGTLIGTVTSLGGSSTFDMTWSQVPAGSYSLTVVATDNQGATAASGPVNITVSSNPIEEASFFVRQHYLDFFGREPDASGLAFWTNNINSCADAGCRESKRIDTSAAFFLSIEFQQTGYFVFRYYKSTFTDSTQRPRGLPRMTEFLTDTRAVGEGVIVGQAGWEQKLEENKQNFARNWVQRAEVVAQLPESLSAAQFVDKLFQNSEVTPTQAERDAAIAAFGAGGVEGRAAALRSVINTRSVYNRQYNPAFVLMQYIGYLRRNPNDAPELTLDYQGYDFWLAKLNQFSDFTRDVREEAEALGRVRRAEMVKSFITSSEYRRRF